VVWVALVALAIGLAILASPVGANGTQNITVKQSNVEPGGDGCVEGEWHLVINQIENESLAPNSVNVLFNDGHTHTESLTKFTGKVAHYTIFYHLTNTLITATTDIYDDWSGQFVVSHTPCITPPCEEEVCVTPTPPPPPCRQEPCVTPTPTLIGTPTPTSTPTPQPTVTPTPTPTTPAETTPTSTGTEQTSLTSTSETPSGFPSTGGEGSDGGSCRDWTTGQAGDVVQPCPDGGASIWWIVLISLLAGVGVAALATAALYWIIGKTIPRL